MTQHTALYVQSLGKKKKKIHSLVFSAYYPYTKIHSFKVNFLINSSTLTAISVMHHLQFMPSRGTEKDESNSTWNHCMHACPAYLYIGPFCLLATNQCDTTAICMKALVTDKFYTVIASTEVEQYQQAPDKSNICCSGVLTERCWCAGLLFTANIPIFAHSIPSAWPLVVRRTHLCSRFVTNRGS